MVAADPTFGIIMLLIFLFIGAFSLISFIIWIWGLVDVLTAKNESNWKILWGAVIFFLGILGVILYALIARKERKN